MAIRVSEPEVMGQLAQALDRVGMVTRGGFPVDAEDCARLLIPETAPGRSTRGLVLIGNAGPAMYRAFFAGAASGPDALDDWTRRMIEPIATSLNARAVFPFGGPPWLPFQRWAVRAEGLKASPLGILIHPEFGLWHAYRAALLFDRELDLPKLESGEYPCESCVDRPCLIACPAGAVTAQGYDVDKCATHVAASAGSACREFGCLARRACPVGRAFTYPSEAMAFHMAAFLKGRNTAESARAEAVPDS